MDRTRVAYYRRMLRDEGKLPPIAVGEKVGKRWKLFDGRHKLKAAKLEGRKTIDVIKVIQGLKP